MRGHQMVLVAVAMALLLAGCGDTGNGSPPPRKPSGAASSSAAAAATDAYLAGEGKLLVDLSASAATFPDRIDRAALADGCEQLARSMNRRFPPGRLIRLLQGLPDGVLSRHLTNEMSAMQEAIRACSDGDAGKARRLARIAQQSAADFDKRRDTLRTQG
ncbi:hypothetical protein [Nocardioides sp. KR10-350]|uniref:hypothetical protein n=1 Tax=Nocardioides cheoyonin TaxID=3156615 RepID=UPI0032B35616